MENQISQKMSEPQCPLGHGRALDWRVVDGHRLVRCPTCGIGFVFPMPKTAPEIYELDYFQGASQGFGYADYDAEKRATVSTLERYLKELQKRNGGTGSLLDVGAASGFFVAVARQRGWKAEGVEISSGAVEMAQKKGLPVRCAPFTAEAMSQEGIFDAITMLDVLEHVPDPAEALRVARAHLRDHGCAFVNVPDAGSVFARIMGAHWQALVPPEHLTYFTRRSLAEMLHQNGFEVVATFAFAKRFRLAYVASTLFRRWKTARELALRLLGSRLGNISIPLPLGDNVSIIARKV